MDPTSGISAADWLAKAEADDIAWVLKEFGEERFAKKIGRAIVHDRVEKPFTYTRQLAELIARLIPNKEKNKHPATRSFQAIRIYINSELEEVEQAMEGALVTVWLPRGGWQSSAFTLSRIVWSNSSFVNRKKVLRYREGCP